MGLPLRANVNSEMIPGMPTLGAVEPFSSSNALRAASSTLKEISFEVPLVWCLMCAARAILSDSFFIGSSYAMHAPRAYSENETAAKSAEPAESAEACARSSSTISAMVHTRMFLLGREFRKALP